MSRMLIVEDCEDTRAMFGMVVCRGTKMKVTEACSAEEALKHLDAADVLCTDLNLGGKVTGLDLAREFKRNKPWRQVILITGSDVKKDRNVDQVLRKPITPEAVLQAAKKAEKARNANGDNVFFRALKAIEASQAVIERSRSLRAQREVYFNNAHPA